MGAAVFIWGDAVIMLTQLEPPLPLYVPSKGASGLAVAVIDYGPDYDLIWTVIMDDTGEIWCLKNSDVRGVRNITHGRK